MDTGAPSRNRTGTPAIHEAADFKNRDPTHTISVHAGLKTIKIVA